VAQAAYTSRMSTQSLYHVSHVASGSMLESRAPSYLRIAASSEGQALETAQRLLGNPEGGEWRVRRADIAPAALAA
jgi:hypothetical protein